MSRIVTPDLLSAWGGVIRTRDDQAVSLRWMISPQLGLPFRPFRIFHLSGADRQIQELAPVQTPIANQWVLTQWTGQNPVAAVQLVVDVEPGEATVLAHSGTQGAGKVVDSQTLTGPASNALVTLTGSSIGSLTSVGNLSITRLTVIDLQSLVDDSGWNLIDTVGLPADDRFTGVYDVSEQGPPGDRVPPMDAAFRRIIEGIPAAFWPPATDTGRATPEFTPPDPDALLQVEVEQMMEQLIAMTQTTTERHQHADIEVSIALNRPESVHGVPSGGTLDNPEARVRPLGTTLLAAGTDPYAALALGFGTTISPQRVDLRRPLPDPNDSRRLDQFDLYMVTLEHEVQIVVEIGGFSFNVPFKGELAAVVVRPQAIAPSPPAALTSQRPEDTDPKLDRPAGIDRPWLEAVDLSWERAGDTVGAGVNPLGYAILQALGDEPLSVLLDERLAGGVRPFLASMTADKARVHFTNALVPERFPREPDSVIFALAAQDWFGRWGAWASIIHPRLKVATQQPVMKQVQLIIDNGGEGPGASAQVTFSWDWADRSPQDLLFRIRVYVQPPDGTAEPPQGGDSRLHPDGPLVADTLISFLSATPDTAPSEVREIVEERVADQRTYTLQIPGLQLPFATHPRLRISAQGRASERVRPGMVSTLSNAVFTSAVSPLPPAAAQVPSAMQWSSLADAAGFAHALLQWEGSAHRYAVYLADETAIARELGLASPNLTVPAADRLIALRALNFGQARRAFRRIADRLEDPQLQITLPLGSQLIQFCGIAPISETGVERALPADANSYFAVATPVREVPAPPRVIARYAAPEVQLHVEAETDPIAVGRLELLRVQGVERAALIDAAGAPQMSRTADQATTVDTTLHWDLVDNEPLPPWEAHFYRAVLWGVHDAPAGRLAGRSPPSAAVEIVVPAANAPVVDRLQVDRLDTAEAGTMVRLHTDAHFTRTRLGLFGLTLTLVHEDVSEPGESELAVSTLQDGLDRLTLLTGRLPDTSESGIYLFRQTGAAPVQLLGWAPTIPMNSLVSVVAEVVDPIGRRTAATWSAP